MRPKPRSIMPGSTAWLAWTAPIRCTFHIVRNTAGSALANGADLDRAGIVDEDGDRPARRFGGGHLALDLARVGDVGNAAAGGVAGGDRSRSGASVRPITVTVAPAPASAAATARPMPRPPPVTKACLPSSAIAAPWRRLSPAGNRRPVEIL